MLLFAHSKVFIVNLHSVFRTLDVLLLLVIAKETAQTILVILLIVQKRIEHALKNLLAALISLELSLV